MKINKNLNIQTENLHGEKIIIIDDFIEEFSKISEIDKNELPNILYPLGKRYKTQFTNTSELLDILNNNYNSLEAQIVKFMDKVDYTEIPPREDHKKFKKYSQYLDKVMDTPYKDIEENFIIEDTCRENLHDPTKPHNKWLMKNIKKEMFIEHPGRPYWKFDDDYIGYVFLNDFSKTNLPKEADYIIPKPALNFYKNLHWKDEVVFKWDKKFEETPLTWYVFWYQLFIRTSVLYKELPNYANLNVLPMTLDEQLLNPGHTLNDFGKIYSIEGKFNRCVLFPGSLFHAQSLSRNWGLERTMATITFK